MTVSGLDVDVWVIDAEDGAALPSADTNYSATVSINTTYDLHPEEALTDNFALLLDQRAGRSPALTDQALLDGLASVLAE